MSGISILLVASFLLSFEKSEKYNGDTYGIDFDNFIIATYDSNFYSS